jgi:hypothetical protein
MRILKSIVLFLALCAVAHGAIQYSGAVPTKATDTPATRTALADFVKTTLDTAGWTCSGVSGDWKCTTASDANATGQIKLRMWDPGSGNCTRLALLNTSESIDLSATAPAYILPDGSTWTIIANKFWAYGFSDGATTARHSFSAGTIYKPTFLSALTTYGNLVSDGINDTDTASRISYRSGIRAGAQVQTIYNASSWGAATIDVSHSGAPGLVFQHATASTSHGKQWMDDSYMIVDPLLTGDTVQAGAAGDGKWVGQYWDVMVVLWKGFVEGSTITYDSKTWQAISNSGTHTMFVYIPTP